MRRTFRWLNLGEKAQETLSCVAPLFGVIVHDVLVLWFVVSSAVDCLHGNVSSSSFQRATVKMDADCRMVLVQFQEKPPVLPGFRRLRKHTCTHHGEHLQVVWPPRGSALQFHECGSQDGGIEPTTEQANSWTPFANSHSLARFPFKRRTATALHECQVSQAMDWTPLSSSLL